MNLGQEEYPGKETSIGPSTIDHCRSILQCSRRWSFVEFKPARGTQFFIPGLEKKESKISFYAPRDLSRMCYLIKYLN